MIKRLSYPFFKLNNVPVNTKTALILGQIHQLYEAKLQSSAQGMGGVKIILTGKVHNSSKSNPCGLVHTCWDFFYDKLATQTTA